MVSEASIQTVNTALAKWSQGDCVVEEQWFVHRSNPKCPLTDGSISVAQEGDDLVESSVEGFAVVTQTCDIVRCCKARPFVEVAPLVRVKEEDLPEIRKGKRPRYAYIPGTAEHKLVADLDRVMTVEKAVVAEWQRIPGCQSDQDVRALGLALARKRIRFAFPDDFVQFANKLQKQMQNKHGKKESPEGKALRSLREIRVRAEPCWNAPEIELMFWFVHDEEQTLFEGITWDKFLEGWLKLVSPTGRFSNVDGLVTSLEDMTAKDYVESDPLDLDYLSSPFEAPEDTSL